MDLLRLYRIMQLIRRVEERLIVDYRRTEQMRCPMHFCVGQESAPAVLSVLLRKEDVMMSHYRSHGYYLAKGGALAPMIAEFYGKATGSNAGLAGSMELGSHEHHFFSGAIVGGSIITPLGAAFAQKYRGASDISIAIIGDGSFDEGVLYESMNLAALHRLPLLIVCENNKYAANTEIAKRLGRADLLPKAEAMGIPGKIVDGYDLDSLFNELEAAMKSVRAGHGPRYVEVMTYRFCAHVGPDSDDYLEYRSMQEIADWRAKDPLQRLRERLVANPDTKAEVARIDSWIEAAISDAVDAAKAAPFPSFDRALTSNSAGSYAPAAEGYFREVAPLFQAGQSETKLEPF